GGTWRRRLLGAHGRGRAQEPQEQGECQQMERESARGMTHVQCASRKEHSMAGEEPHHTSYEKIVERPEQWALEDRGYRALKKSPWVVTEKIHGANFALLSDGQTVRCAKRKAMLAEGE